MSLLPFEELQEAAPVEEIPSMPKEYGLDFETGQLDGRIVTGIEAIKVWIWNALQTSRYRYYIYSWDYGAEYEDLIGKSYSQAYTEAEMETMTEEALLVNPYILGVDDFTVKYEEGGRLVVHFTVNTRFGEVNANVRADDLRIHYE